MRRIIPILCLALGGSLYVQAQLYIDNATFFIESGATVTVQGDVTSNTSIQGTGKILLKGTTLQSVNMNNGGAATNAYTIPNLEIDNAANARLTGNVRIGSSLIFTNGKIQAENFNVVLANTATTTGVGTGKFIETNGTGFAQREIGSAAGTGTLPIGIGSTYSPITLTHSGGTYSNALLSAQAKAGKSPAAHPRTESYTNVYWPVATTGITGGTFTATANYTNPGNTGTETDIRGMSYNGSVWSLTGGNQDFAAKTITAQLAGNTGQLVGMNRFLLLNTNAMLQGAFEVATGLMRDRLRNSTGTYVVGTLPASNVIPLSDPYRSLPEYSGYFSHTSNASAELVTSNAVFNDLANPNDNIVDWVFLELRNAATSGNIVLQSRSALIQRDGDIVDIDGISPIYFKNLDAGNYSVGIRHRNHLGMYTNPAAYTSSLSLSPSALVNLRATSFAANINGTAGDAYATSGVLNLLLSGNVSGNTVVRYQGSNGPGNINQNDRAILLSDLSNVESNTISGYKRGDLNLNRIVRYQGSDGPGILNNNDRAFLLSQPLAGSESISKTEARPN